jgi:hypothetical protein
MSSGKTSSYPRASSTSGTSPDEGERTPSIPQPRPGAFGQAQDKRQPDADAAKERVLKQKAMAELKERQDEWRSKEKMEKQLRMIRNPSDDEKQKLHDVQKWLLVNQAPQFAGRTRRRKNKKLHKKLKKSLRRKRN